MRGCLACLSLLGHGCWAEPSLGTNCCLAPGHPCGLLWAEFHFISDSFLDRDPGHLSLRCDPHTHSLECSTAGVTQGPSLPPGQPLPPLVPARKEETVAGPRGVGRCFNPTLGR